MSKNTLVPCCNRQDIDTLVADHENRHITNTNTCTEF